MHLMRPALEEVLIVQPRALLVGVFLADLLLLFDLITGLFISHAAIWLILHLICSVLVAFYRPRICDTAEKEEAPDRVWAQRSRLLVFVFAFFIPGVGGPGMVAAISYAAFQSARRADHAPALQVTRAADLPLAAPKLRKQGSLDGRGFAEHLLYSSDDEDIYRKVLAAGSLETSISNEFLQQATRHSDERIRLLAIKTLHAQRSRLNRGIVQLVRRVRTADLDQRSEIWLQIASHYWELLGIGVVKPLARVQLLDRSAQAALRAIDTLPNNRAAHFLLGRISLAQGDSDRARESFESALFFGMSKDKVAPYLAETAFKQRDFAAVKLHLAKLDPAVVGIPPLSHVVNQWAS